MSKLEAGIPDWSFIIDLRLTNYKDSYLFWAEGPATKNVDSAISADKVEHIAGFGPIPRYSFKGSYANSVYRDCNTVQPPAIQLIPQLRY